MKFFRTIMSEKFSLKWIEFYSNVSKSFGIFRNEDYLQDVTLITNDDTHIAAHRLVLSTCSEYFRNIFKRNKIGHLNICLDGVSSNELGNILDYMYNGEVQIFQDEMDKFLEVAQRFKLEGLQNEQNSEMNNETKKKPKTKIKPKKEKQETSIENIIPINQENAEIRDLESLNVYDQSLYENMEQNSEGMYVCKLCDKTIKMKTHMKYHIETHIVGLTFQCHICEKNFKSRNSLNVHRTLYHRA